MGIYHNLIDLVRIRMSIEHSKYYVSFTPHWGVELHMLIPVQQLSVTYIIDINYDV